MALPSDFSYHLHEPDIFCGIIIIWVHIYNIWDKILWWNFSFCSKWLAQTLQIFPLIFEFFCVFVQKSWHHLKMVFKFVLPAENGFSSPKKLQTLSKSAYKFRQYRFIRNQKHHLLWGTVIHAGPFKCSIHASSYCPVPQENTFPYLYTLFFF